MFTVYSDYFATGEGRTISILYTLHAQTPEEALKKFKTTIPHGDWYGKGAEVIQGFDFDNHVAKFLVTEVTKELLLNPRCNRDYFAHLHYNFC